MFIINLIISILTTILRGWLIKVFWGWFVLTQFPGVPNISISGAIGLSLVVAVLAPWRRATREELEESSEDAVARGVVSSLLYGLGCLILLGVGWVVHSCM
jgi:hypothetical protein